MHDIDQPLDGWADQLAELEQARQPSWDGLLSLSTLPDRSIPTAFLPEWQSVICSNSAISSSGMYCLFFPGFYPPTSLHSSLYARHIYALPFAQFFQ